MKVFAKISFLLLFVVALSFGATANHQPADNGIIILPQGTPVQVELDERVYSEEVMEGTVLQFTVSRDVIVNRQVVIRAGSMAEGRVEKVQHATMTACDLKCPRMTIRVTTVTAVDGSQVRLGGRGHQMRPDCCSAEGNMVSMLTRLTANVQSDVTIML